MISPKQAEEFALLNQEGIFHFVSKKKLACSKKFCISLQNNSSVFRQGKIEAFSHAVTGQ